MRRSSRWQSGRRSASRSTAPAIRRAPTASLLARPDGGRQLADGLLVEASVVARLFRIRLLAIDARLIVTPAQVTADASPPRSPVRATGTRLAAAERLLDEAAATRAR
jgi:hypothetical protein